MNTNHKPATPLPWRQKTFAVLDAGDEGVAETYERGDTSYIAHACNHYPELVEALKELVARCDGAEGVRADGSNIQTHNAHALLTKLGEA